ncbi:MAG: oxygen-independent coproporphyrinogen III oxidase [Candidatus Zixiibacteriota bacterium]
MSPETAGTTVPVELLRKYDRSGPRYTSYPTVPVWKEEIGRIHYEEALRAASERATDPLAIYCHIPFCQRRCYYCGCNTVITNSTSRVDSYSSALLRETRHVVSLLGDRRTINQLHFGGGTPTFIDPARFARILQSLSEEFRFEDGCEKSIEVDPRVTSFDQIDFLSENGFNRISLGVQDFDQSVQKAVGRVQSFELVADLIAHCRTRGFKGINIDLIYGLPCQTAETFENTLELSLRLKPDRVAVYSFAYLPKAMPHQSMIRYEDLPSTETKYRLISTAVERFTGGGYRQIGMDHFALPNDELAIAQVDGRLHRNFMGYTVQAAPEMIGLGMSSIGYVDNGFYQNLSRLDSYQTAIDRDKTAVYRGIRLSRDDQIRQFVISTLMCNFQLPFSGLQTRFGVNFIEYFVHEQSALAEFVDDDLLVIGDDGLRITALGRTFVRNIAMTFDAYLQSQETTPGSTFSRTI